MSQANAWLLEMGGGCRAAVGRRELFHLIDAAATYEVPLAPNYCQQVVLWQDRLLPVLDMAARTGQAVATGSFLAVVGYQQQRGELPQFGALRLAAPPRQLLVNDEQACALTPELDNWRPWVIACFDQHGQAVPVLDLWRLFNTAPTGLDNWDRLDDRDEKVDTSSDAG